MKKLAKLFLVFCVLLANIQTAIPAHAAPPQATTSYGEIISPAPGSPLSPDDTGKVTIQATASGGSGAEVSYVKFWALYDGEWHDLGNADKAPYQVDWYPGCIPPQEILLGIHIVDTPDDKNLEFKNAMMGIHSDTTDCKLIAPSIHILDDQQYENTHISIIDLKNPLDRKLGNPNIHLKIMKSETSQTNIYNRLFVKDFVAQDPEIQTNPYVAINGTAFENLPKNTGTIAGASRLSIGDQVLSNGVAPRYFFQYDGDSSSAKINLHKEDSDIWPLTEANGFVISYNAGILDLRKPNDGRSDPDACLHPESRNISNRCLDPDHTDYSLSDEIQHEDAIDWTIIGTSQNNDKVFLVAGIEVGAQELRDLSRELKRLGAAQAFLLDSGHSTQMSASNRGNYNVDAKEFLTTKVLNGIVAYYDPQPHMIYNLKSHNVGLDTYDWLNNQSMTAWVDWGNPTLTDGWIPALQLRDVPPLFLDTGKDNPFYYWIQLLKLAGIIDGYSDGSYRSNEIVYRDAMAKYIANALDKAGVLKREGYNSVQACGQNFKNAFPDVNENTQFHDEIWCITALGIVNGYSDGNYHPERPVLRDQMAKYIVNASAKAGILSRLGYETVQQCAEHGTEFRDVDGSNKFHDEIKCIVALGIVSGYSDGTYRPSESMTRGPMAKYIANGNNSLLAQAVCYPTYPETNCQDTLVWAQAQKLAPIIQKNNASDLAFARAVIDAANVEASLNTEALSLLQSGVWLASPHGVIYYNPDNGKLISYTVKDKLPHNKVNAIAQNPVNGEIWACTNLGVAKFDGNRWISYVKSNGLSHSPCNDIAISPSGIVWVATKNGLSRFDGKWANYFTQKHTLPENNIRTIALDSQGNPWSVIANRLSYFDGKVWRAVKKLLGSQVDSLAFANNILYMGHNHGILKYENDRFNSIKPTVNVDALISDGDGYIWVISNRSKLGVYHKGDWVVTIP